jgi:thiol-disulfide isomerase/thioredoxin
MTVGAWIAIAVLLAATAFGVWRRRTDGHFRGSASPGRQVGHPAPAQTAAPRPTGAQPTVDRPAGAQPTGDRPVGAQPAGAQPAGAPGEDPPLDADGHLPSAEDSDWGLDDHNPHELVRTTLAAAVPRDLFGERATLVQFSSAFCAPCRVARRVLGDVAEVVPGVAHVEVDAEAHLDIVRVLGIVRTPTTIVVDAAGREASRAVGAPRKEQVLAALGEAV